MSRNYLQSQQFRDDVSRDLERDDRRAATAGKPWLRHRHPPGCPDGDFCAGNGVCFWGCVDDGLDDSGLDAQPKRLNGGDDGQAQPQAYARDERRVR